MEKIETSFGTLYIEGVDGREEDDRIKLFDSDKRYLDYFATDSIPSDETVEQFIAGVVSGIKRQKTVADFLDYIGLESYSISGDWKDLLNYVYGKDFEIEDGKCISLEDGSEITEEIVMGNEWVNKIGELYVFIVE